MSRRLPPIMRGRRRRLLLALAGNGLLQGLGAALASVALGRLTAVGPDQTTTALLTITAAALALAWLRQRERIDAERLGQDYAVEVRDRLFAAAFAAPAQGADRPAGALLLRFVTDLDGLRQWASRGLAVLIGDGLYLLALLLVMAAHAPWLAAIAAAGAVLLGVVLLAVRRPLRSADGELRRRRGRLSGGLARRLADHGAFDLERERRRLRRRGAALADAAIERARWQGITRGAAVAVAMLTMAALLLAARRGAIAAEPGAWVMAIAMASLIGAPLRRLARAFELRQTWRVARARAENLLAAGADPTTPEGGATRPASRIPPNDPPETALT